LSSIPFIFDVTFDALIGTRFCFSVSGTLKEIGDEDGAVGCENALSPSQPAEQEVNQGTQTLSPKKLKTSLFKPKLSVTGSSKPVRKKIGPQKSTIGTSFYFFQ